MENLTYEIYLADPAVRERLEREARQLRAEAFQQYIVWKLFRRALKRAESTLTPRATDVHSESTWKTAPESGAIQLKRGSTLRLVRGRGTIVHVVDGNVWLTQYRDTADYMMRAGDRMVLNGAGITLIRASEDSSLRFVAPGDARNAPRVKARWKHRILVLA